MKKVQKINLTMDWSQEMTSMASAEGLKQQIHEFSLFSLSSVGYKLLPAKVFEKSILCFSTSKWPWHASSVSTNESLVLFQCWICFMIKQWNAFGCWCHLWWVLWWVFCLLFNPKRNNEPLASLVSVGKDWLYPLSNSCLSNQYFIKVLFSSLYFFLQLF